jgi:hypothetical protein
MISPINRMHDVVDLEHRRPTEQWWLDFAAGHAGRGAAAAEQA